MTDFPLSKHGPESDSEWSRNYAAYQAACEALRRATALTKHLGDEIDILAVDEHNQAAQALIHTPATRIAHIAQKLRAADNFLNLSQIYPGFPGLLLDDLFGLMGIDSGDASPLPSPIH